MKNKIFFKSVQNSGNDDELDDDAYDYQRLIAHLTGKKKKLAVAVENRG